MGAKWKNAGLFILNICCIVFILYRLVLKENEVKTLKREIYKITLEKDGYITKLENTLLRFKMYFVSEGCRLSPEIVIKAENEKTLLLKELVKNGKKLVLRISNTHCPACLYDLCPSVARFLKSVGKENVIYLSDYDNARTLTLLKSNYKIDHEVYSVKKIDLPLEESNVPYLFLLDENLKIELIFAPIKELPELTDSYFQIIKSRI